MPKMIKIKVKDYDHPDYENLKLTYEIEFDQDKLGKAIQEVLDNFQLEQTQQSESDKDKDLKKKFPHPHTRPIPTELTADLKAVIKP